MFSIFLNDLFQGYQNGIYKKEDKNKNIIGAVAKEHLKNFFDGDRLIVEIEDSSYYFEIKDPVYE